MKLRLDTIGISRDRPAQTEGSASKWQTPALQRDPNRHRSRWCRQHPSAGSSQRYTTTVPKIDVGSPPSAITDPYTLLTSQRVQFSAARSDDNVPLNHRIFTWDLVMEPLLVAKDCMKSA